VDYLDKPANLHQHRTNATLSPFLLLQRWGAFHDRASRAIECSVTEFSTEFPGRFCAGGRGYVPTPSADPLYLYADLVVAIRPKAALNNGESSFHARLMAPFTARPGEHVVHIGAGTGYFTAVPPCGAMCPRDAGDRHRPGRPTDARGGHCPMLGR
jgi:hypothetical protein